MNSQHLHTCPNLSLHMYRGTTMHSIHNVFSFFQLPLLLYRFQIFGLFCGYRSDWSRRILTRPHDDVTMKPRWLTPHRAKAPVKQLLSSNVFGSSSRRCKLLWKLYISSADVCLHVAIPGAKSSITFIYENEMQ